MSNILIVVDNGSYLVTSMQERLISCGHIVKTVKPDISKISSLKESFGAILIYAEDDISDWKQSLIFIKDKAVEEDIPIYPIGSPEELNNIKALIPTHMVQQSFTRPINISEIVETLDNYLKHFAKENKKKILVVDDSGAMLRSVKEWLSESYQVILANSGAMAMKYLVTNRPDLVLLDYEMPVVDGKKVLEMIRTEAEFADIPVIFLTSKGDRESVMEVMALKPEGYLLKTMEPAQIIKNVDEFFERQKAKNC